MTSDTVRYGSDIDIAGDDVLNLEDEYYNKGYEEGQQSASKDQLKEGKEYGYQTGFQRNLVIGYIQGLVEYWEKNLGQYDVQSLPSHLSQLREIVNDVPITNGDAEVEEFERRLRKARNKLRVVCTLLKETWKIQDLDELVKEMGGQLQVSENVDDMW